MIDLLRFLRQRRSRHAPVARPRRIEPPVQELAPIEYDLSGLDEDIQKVRDHHPRQAAATQRRGVDATTEAVRDLERHLQEELSDECT